MFERADAEAKASPVGKLLIDAGFIPTHTGGGCRAWEKILNDGDQLLVTHEDMELLGDPNTRRWLIGRYSDDDFVDDGPFTLATALKEVANLPKPDADLAECIRNGHTDTGRGVCADCGTFL